MPFCMQCGARADYQQPSGDHKERLVCSQCQFIFYNNPKIICGAIASWQNKILLCQRAIEPGYGYWNLPAGFMEIGETTEQGAARETQEEAEAFLEAPKLYCIYNLPALGQVYMLYRATLLHGKFGIGSESLACALFEENEIPWEQLAFATVTRTLKHYFNDRVSGHFPIHQDTITDSFHK